MALTDEQRATIRKNRRAVARQVALVNTQDSLIRELINFDRRYANRLSEAEVLEDLETERAAMAEAAEQLVTLSTRDLELESGP